MLSDLMWTLYGFAYLFRSIAFGALSPLSGQQEGHLACKKKLSVGVRAVMISLELCTPRSASFHHRHELTLYYFPQRIY